jgi:hypothetical protein
MELVNYGITSLTSIAFITRRTLTCSLLKISIHRHQSCNEKLRVIYSITDLHLYNHIRPDQNILLLCDLYAVHRLYSTTPNQLDISLFAQTHTFHQPQYHKHRR